MNLDELNELFTCAWTNDDKALMFEGIVRGSNGVIAPSNSPAQMRKANELGLKWRKEAEDFLAKSSADGKKSAEARKAKYGTAQPPSDISRTPFEESPNQATSYKLQAVKDKQQETKPLASLTSVCDEQYSENKAVNPSEATTQMLASSQTSSTQPQSEALAPQTAKKKRNVSAPKKHILPLEEFVAWAKDHHPTYDAAAWWKRMDSQDWIDGHGNEIKNSKAKFNTAITNGWIKPKLATAKPFVRVM